MKIGETDIMVYGAKQLTVEFLPPEFEDGTEWLDGAALPYEKKRDIKYSGLKLSLLVRDRALLDRDDRGFRDRTTVKSEAARSISGILFLLTGTVSLILDGYRSVFVGSLISAETEKTKSPEVNILHLEFKGYLRDGDILHTSENGAEIFIEVSGTRETPCVLEITPSAYLETLVISGLTADDITVSDLQAGKTLVLDGGACTATVDGENAFDKVDLWEFPRLAPGKGVTVRFSAMSGAVTLRYQPMWI